MGGIREWDLILWDPNLYHELSNYHTKVSFNKTSNELNLKTKLKDINKSERLEEPEIRSNSV